VPDLSFHLEGAEPVPFAAAPLLALKLRVNNADPQEIIQTVALRCQIQIETTRRRYDPIEQDRLFELFDRPERWGQTLRTMLWTHASVIIPTFSNSTLVDLPVPCTYDFNVAVTKYFAGLENGEIPLCILFSGTVFYETDEGALQAGQIPWDREARYSLPVRVWRQMMDIYYPNSAWLSIRQDVFDRLYGYKRRHGIPTWEETLDRVLSVADAMEDKEGQVEENTQA
jgi:hypothetical protein